jgi:hypothetical protein
MKNDISVSRRDMIRTGILASAAASGPGLLNIFVPSKNLELETVYGPVIIYRSSPASILPSAHAQNYHLNYQAQQAAYYQAMMAQQMYAMQMAQAQWQAQMMAQQAHYEWLNQQRMQQAMAAYQAMAERYQNMSGLSVWEKPKSMYAQALTDNGQLGLVGVNKEGNRVEVLDSHVALTKVAEYSANVKHNNLPHESRKKEVQFDVGPQTSEKKAEIVLPDNTVVAGKGFGTSGGGGIAVSKEPQPTNFGMRDIVKFKIGDDGEQYMVI